MSSEQKFRSISFKFIFIIALVLLVSTAIGTTLIVFNQRNSLNQFLYDKGHTLASYIANISKDAILLKDTIQLDAIVSEAIKDNDVAYALIIDAEGKPLTTAIASFNDNMPQVKAVFERLSQNSGVPEKLAALKKGGISTELVQAVMIESSDYGKVLIGLSDAQVRKELLRTILFVLAVNITVTLLMGFILYKTSKRLILAPIEQLCTISGAVAGGDLTGSLLVINHDEIGNLTQSLNSMVAGLSGMVHRIGDSANHLTSISANILTASKQVIAAAELQSVGVEETSSAIDEIGYSLRSVAEGVNHLAGATEENNSSTLEMAASIEEVGRNVETLAAAVEEIGSSIAEMAASIRQVAASADSLHQASEITASSINEMDAAIREVEENAIATATIAEGVRRDAEIGKSAVDSTIIGMQGIKESSAVSTEVIKTLSNKVEKIGNILSVIDEVVAQINLLSLNAAIIAAQAGEHGKGFSVVADEIKKLSERTGFSTREIAVVIEGVQEESRRAVDAINQAEQSIVEGERLSQLSGEALIKIVDGVQKATEQMDEIARSTCEQARGSNMIRRAMGNISDMIRQIVVATNQQKKGGEQIMAAAERMKRLTVQVRSSTREQSQSSGAIARSTEKMSTMIEQIKRACDEQERGSGLIVHAIENIRSSTEVNLDAVRVMDSSVAGLSEQTESLLHEMATFRVKEKENL